MEENLYKALGKLFYAVAKADGTLTMEEYKRFYKTLETKWDDLSAAQRSWIKSTFFEFQRKSFSAEEAFEAFEQFAMNHQELFPSALQKRIINSTSAIAYAFSGINKSELYYLAKLSLVFKKLGHEK